MGFQKERLRLNEADDLIKIEACCNTHITALAVQKILLADLKSKTLTNADGIRSPEQITADVSEIDTAFSGLAVDITALLS